MLIDVNPTPLKETKTVNLTFEHKCDDDVLHKLSTVIVIQNDNAMTDSSKSDQTKVEITVAHTNKNNQLWMVN